MTTANGRSVALSLEVGCRIPIHGEFARSMEAVRLSWIRDVAHASSDY